MTVFETLLDRAARIRADTLESQPWEALPEANRRLHRERVRLELQLSFRFMEFLNFRPMPDTLSDALAIETALKTPLNIDGKVVVLPPDVVKSLYAALISEAYGEEKET